MRFWMSDRWFQDSKSPSMFQAAARRSACRAAARHSLKRRAVPGRLLPSAAVRSSDGARCSIVTMHTARMGLGGKRDLLVSGTDYSSNYSRSRSRERMEVTMFDRRGVKRRLGERWLHTSGPSGKPRPAEEKREEGAPGEPSKVDPVDEGPGSHARESIWTTPNMITMTRIACSPVLSWFILQDEYEKALAGVIVAAFTDWLDGYIAKNYNQTSILGGFLDPLADKVLVAALALPLAYQGHLPAPLLVIWVGRDLLLVAGSFVKRAMSRPEGSPFFDTTSTATFQIRPNNLSKFNTALQFTVLSMSVSRAMWGLPGPEIFEPLCWLVGGTTVASGLTYLAGDGTGLLKKRKGLKK